MSERREVGIEPHPKQSFGRGPQTIPPSSERGPSGPAVTAESGQA
jgi:hypothetical protein